MATLKVPLCGLRDTNNGYNAVMEKKEDADVLLSPKGKETLLNSILVQPSLQNKGRGGRYSSGS